MKIFKGIALVIFLNLILGACFTPPQFPTVPEITFNKIEFIDDPSTQTDSLVLYFNFRDGDGDLGIDPTNLYFLSYPYNTTFFFQENPGGGIDTLVTFIAAKGSDQYEIIDIPNPQKGKLITIHTRKKPQYSTLPTFKCGSYELAADKDKPDKPSQGRKILIEKANKSVLDLTYTKIVDSLVIGSNAIPFYQILDTMYVQSNPDHYNIQVDFLVKDPTNPAADKDGFVFFDWMKLYCQTFNGRFPVLSNNSNSLEGTMSYSLTSIGFKPLFSVKPLKLRVQIKDRQLHRSNIIETPEFTLDKIRK